MKRKKGILKKTQSRTTLVLCIAQCATFGTLSSQYVCYSFLARTKFQLGVHQQQEFCCRE